MTRLRSTTVLAAIAAVLILAPQPVLAGTTFILNNVDPPGVGFNDPTPVAPIGGNPGTTLGEQRLNLFQFTADLWGFVLESDVEIVVQATFNPGSTFFGDLPCTPTSAVLGAAGTIQIFADFPNAGFAGHWYHSALANKLAGVDLAPGPPDPGFLVPPFADDIVALFNDLLDSDPTCLGGVGWYYGFDNNSGASVDLLNVLVHEFAHGLGFSEFISETSGEGPLGLPDIYTVFMRDLTLNENWNTMTAADRLFSQVNTFNLVWDGANVTADAPGVLGPQPVVTVFSPASIAGNFEAQTASFGPPFGTIGGDDDDDDTDSDSDSDSDDDGAEEFEVIEVDDGVGVASDGCEPILNDLTGAIALIDRGACNFTVKVVNAQNAGAVGAIIVNNLAKGFPPLGGTDPTIVIPTAGLTLDDGATIRAELPGVTANFDFDANVLAGTTGGFVRLFNPDPVQPGSSKSHWDTSATPNLIMEPSITSTLRASEDLDLTPSLFLDEGWTLMKNDDDDDSDSD